MPAVSPAERLLLDQVDIFEKLAVIYERAQSVDELNEQKQTIAKLNEKLVQLRKEFDVLPVEISGLQLRLLSRILKKLRVATPRLSKNSPSSFKSNQGLHATQGLVDGKIVNPCWGLVSDYFHRRQVAREATVRSGKQGTDDFGQCWGDGQSYACAGSPDWKVPVSWRPCPSYWSWYLVTGPLSQKS